MSVALTIHPDDVLRPAVPTGVVAVHDRGFVDRTAVCSCGWSGRRRYLKAMATNDAWMHSIHQRCTVAVPLVMPPA